MRFFIGNKIIESENYQFCDVDSAIKNLERLNEIELDTETTGLCPHKDKMLCIQLGNKYEQYVFDLSVVNINKLKSLLESDKLFILQNAKFDLKMLYKVGIKLKNVYDTFLAEIVLNNGKTDVKLSLDGLCEKYLNVKLDKSVRANIQIEGLSERVIIYSAEDVRYLGEIKKYQLIEAEKNNLLETIKLENEVVKVFALMEFNGVTLDTKIWKEVIIETKKKLNRLEKELDSIVMSENLLKSIKPQDKQLNLFGFDERDLNINWASAKQKLEILNLLKLNVNSTGEDVLQKIKNKHDLIPKLIEFNRNKKLNSSFGENVLNFINSETKRIHPEYWQIVETGRISCKNPNLLNIPSKGELAPKIRSAFKARQNYKFVGGDYSGMELAIIAHLSGDEMWVNTLNRGEDLHSVLCSLTFNIPIENVRNPFPNNPKMSYRDVQKTISFGLAYGMSEFKLADRLSISIDEAKAIINSFFRRVPKVNKFLKKLAKWGVSKGYIITPPPFNRKRYFEGWYKEFETEDLNKKLKGSIERKSMNSPIQGMNADIIKKALINTQNYIDKYNLPVNILMSVYDEINTECLESISEDWKNTLESIMIETAKKYITTVPIKADCYIADYWKK